MQHRSCNVHVGAVNLESRWILWSALVPGVGAEVGGGPAFGLGAGNTPRLRSLLRSDETGAGVRRFSYAQMPLWSGIIMVISLLQLMLLLLAIQLM